MAAPIPDKSVDVVISQEALLHVPDRRRAMAEAFRILRSRGKLAFTDWVAPAPLAKDDADLLWEGQAVQALESPKSYRDLLTDIGFRVRSSDDLTAQWAVLLKVRLAMYQKLRLEAEAAGTPAGHDAFHKSYVRLVDLIGRACSRRRQDRRGEEIATGPLFSEPGRAGRQTAATISPAPEAIQSVSANSFDSSAALARVA